MSFDYYPAWNGVRPLDWYQLIHQAESIRAHYHLGLASVWQHINRRDYDNARTALDRVIDDIKHGYWDPERDDIRRGYWCPELQTGGKTP